MNLPITRLTDDPEVVRRLMLLGIERASELVRLTCDELVWQFGEEGRRLWGRVRGEEEPVWEEEKEESPLKGVWEVEGLGMEGFRYLVCQTFDRVIQELAEQERRLRSVRLTFEPVCMELKFSRGAKDGAGVFASLESRFGKLEQAPVCVTWEVVATFRIAAHRLTFFPPREEEQRRRLAGVLEELKGRRDPKGLMGVVWDDRTSRLPERRAHLESLLKRGVFVPLCLPVPFGEEMHERVVEEWEIAEEWWTEELIARRYVRLWNGKRLFWDRLENSWYAQ